MKITRTLAISLAMLLVTCASIPYRASIRYGGASASYDGKRVLLDIDGNAVADSLHGFSK